MGDHEERLYTLGDIDLCLDAFTAVLDGRLVKTGMEDLRWRTSSLGPKKTDLTRLWPMLEPRLEDLAQAKREREEWAINGEWLYGRNRDNAILERLADDCDLLFNAWQAGGTAASVAGLILRMALNGDGSINMADLQRLGDGELSAASLRIIAATTLRLTSDLPLSQNQVDLLNQR